MNAILLIDFQKEFFQSNGVLKKKCIDVKLANRTARFVKKLFEHDSESENFVFIFVRSCYDDWTDSRAPHININEKLVDIDDRLCGSHFGGNCCEKNSVLHEFVDEIDTVYKNLQTQASDRTFLIEKTYYSAFTNTALEDVLRRQNVKNVFLAGVTSTSCVQATAFNAHHLGFETFLITDCTAASNLERHCEAVSKLSLNEVWRLTTSNELHHQVENGWSVAQTLPFRFVPSVLSSDLAEHAFEKLRDELRWQEMLHGGRAVSRLVCTQGTRNARGDTPLYRFPTDLPFEVEPWSNTLLAIQTELVEKFAQQLNHAKAQLYSSRRDSFISPHTDKTLDIRHGSFICNLSLGATRTFHLRSKRDKSVHFIIEMPSNSAILFDTNNNALFHHWVPADKREARQHNGADKLHDGQRISIVFRDIATFLTPSGHVYGQGGRFKSFNELQISLDRRRDDGENSDNDDNNRVDHTAQTKLLLAAFKAENTEVDFDWHQHYDRGFDVVCLNQTH